MPDVHAGHRQRLRDRARADALRSFQPHEVLELLLMQVIPQRDVNPVAHRIIDRFGSVYAALQAPEEELIKVDGVGRRSAQWLRAMGEMALAYSECSHQPGAVVMNSAQAVAYLSGRPRQKNGMFAIVFLDRSGHILREELFTPGPEGIPSAREMVQAALSNHAAQVFSVRYAQEDSTGEFDRKFAKYVSELFRMVEILHLDHFVASAGGFVSARRAGTIDAVKKQDSMAAEKE